LVSDAESDYLAATQLGVDFIGIGFNRALRDRRDAAGARH
jgi:hypothetical protein